MVNIDICERKTLGNNKFHDPRICQDCRVLTCEVCSNGPRGVEFLKAEAETRMRDMIKEIYQDDF